MGVDFLKLIDKALCRVYHNEHAIVLQQPATPLEEPYEPCQRKGSLLITYWSESTFIIVMIRWTGLAP